MRTMSSQGSHGAVAFDPNWRTILECAAREVFEMMAGVQLRISSSSEEQQGEETAMVGLAGALCGMVTLRCSRQSSVRLVSLMLGGEGASNPSTARDALGEMCNMIAGNFKGKVSQLADRCLLSVPTVISGEDYSLAATDPNQGVTIVLLLEGEPIWLSLIIQS